MLALLAAVALAAPEPLPEGDHWARFSRIPALARRDDPGMVVRVGLLSERLDRNADGGLSSSREYWLERQVVLLGRRQSLMWADTRTCPAARAQLAHMEELAPRFVTLGNEDTVAVVADGASYTLDAPVDGANGSMHVETSYEGPIKAWIDAMLAALAPCWTTTRPVLDRAR